MDQKKKNCHMHKRRVVDSTLAQTASKGGLHFYRNTDFQWRKEEKQCCCCTRFEHSSTLFMTHEMLCHKLGFFQNFQDQHEMRKVPWFICGLHNRTTASIIQGRDLRPQSLDFVNASQNVPKNCSDRHFQSIILVCTDESIIRKVCVVCFAGPIGNIYMFRLCDVFFYLHITYLPCVPGKNGCTVWKLYSKSEV